MPSARRCHRRGRRRPRRPVGGILALLVMVALVIVIIVGSIAEVHAQSAGERSMTDRGYGALASQVIQASNQTGAALAAIVKEAPTLPNTPWPATSDRGGTRATRNASVPGHSARVRIQQVLDASVATAQEESAQIARIGPPGPPANVASRLDQVMADRAAAVTNLRSTLDDLLGMAPLPTAGAVEVAKQPIARSDGVPSITVAQATAQVGSDAALLRQSDGSYAALVAQLRRGLLTGGARIDLPASVWAGTGSSLAASRLSGVPALLTAPSASALVPFHQVIISAVGLVPTAIPSAAPGDQAGSGIVGTWCYPNPPPTSAVPNGTPTVIPQTSYIGAEVTVTNCGTVAELNVPVTERLTLSDPAGTAPVIPKDAGSTYRTRVTLAAGDSQALVLKHLDVAGGHHYTLSIALTVPAGQGGLAGTTQKFLLAVTK